MASVQMRNVIKVFAGTQVLKGVDFDIHDGEFLSLVGPSGCGKSTLLRMLAGLEEISGGEIHIGGQVVNSLAAKDRDIAMVFQNYALYPHMTVRENLSFALEMRREFKAHIEKQVVEVANILGLQALLDRYPRQLSGGQQQRVAMGRAIVRNPQVFLFDEPLSNLDAKLRVHMRTEIKDLHERLKTTTVYVTHDQIEAMTMADRIVVMRAGIVEQIGTPLELYDRPANSFVGTFIGSPAMNLLRGKLVSSGEGAVFEHQSSGQTMALGKTAAMTAPGTEIDLGIRPEHFALSDKGFAARVVVVEPTGAETQVVADIGDERVTAVVKDRVSIGRGDMVFLAPDLPRVHRFDAGTGSRLP